ncbi:MAG: hypothetical protein V3U70_03315 [Thermoplasmata archaeon]
MEGREGGDQGRFRAAFNWNTTLLIFGGIIVSVPIGFLLVSLPVYLQRLPVFETETTLIGVVLTATGVTAVALMVPVGLMADRFGRRRVSHSRRSLGLPLPVPPRLC